MTRKYKTSIYKKATKNIKQRENEAKEIVNKSKIVDTEITLTKLLIFIIIIMFSITPFIIAMNKKHRSTKINLTETNGGLMNEGEVISQSQQISQTQQISQMLNEVGKIF